MVYDVIVIGAGPSGATAAKTLAEKGLKTLLLEKCKLPRYKSCSGILIDRSLRAVEKYFGSAVPAQVTCEPIENRGMVFVADDGREYRFESRGSNIWRDKFDHWLTLLACDAGAEVRDGSNVLSVFETDDEVCINVNGTIEKANYAVDCTGAVGLGANDSSRVITYQTYNTGAIDPDPHYFYAYLQPELSEYDAWFNVKDDFIVLGVACENAKNIDHYYGKFVRYMQREHGLRINERRKIDKWTMRRVVPPYNIDIGSDRIFKAGESAGLLNPMGEGISAALKSGFFAAQAISENFRDKHKALCAYGSYLA